MRLALAIDVQADLRGTAVTDRQLCANPVVTGRLREENGPTGRNPCVDARLDTAAVIRAVAFGSEVGHRQRLL